MRCPKGKLSTDIFTMENEYAVWIYNLFLGMISGLSNSDIWPISMFKTVSETLRNCHVLGCPTYVLEPKLQNPGMKIPKWDPRSQRGVNMGFSKMNSTQVVLVLNLLTGSISPQYHVVFDDMFSTVMSSTAADP